MALRDPALLATTTTSAALELDALRKTYGRGEDRTEALRGVTLHVDDGERFALLGPNGAGKTTLVSIVATLLAASGGSARVLGHDVDAGRKTVRSLVGYVPQDIALYPMLPAAENLKFFGAMHGLRGGQLRERMREVLEIVGLEDVAKKRVETFSGGMKRRLNLAVGLLHRPRLLLLDEPTVGVDPQSRAHILDAVRELNERHGMTILYTTHYMDEVETLCRRVAIIDHGEIIADDTVASLTGDGSGAALSVRCDAPAALAASLRRVPRVGDVIEAEDGAVRFTAGNSASALARLAQVAAEQGIELQDVAISRVSLEQVFLRLTGRALRDK